MGEVGRSTRIEQVGGRVVETADVLAACLAEQPGHRRLLPDQATRYRVLRTVYTASVRDAVQHGVARVAVGAKDGEDPAVLGAVLAMPPGTLPLSLARRARKLPALIRAACIVPRSFPRYARSMRARMAILPPPGEWWCLHTIGVHPRAPRLEVGTPLMRDMLGVIDETGSPCYLFESAPEWIELCERFGFTVEERLADGPAEGFAMMCRPPAG